MQTAVPKGFNCLVGNKMFAFYIGHNDVAFLAITKDSSMMNARYTKVYIHNFALKYIQELWVNGEQS